MNINLPCFMDVGIKKICHLVVLFVFRRRFTKNNLCHYLALRSVRVETVSYVTDPLGRVPNVPFGHLHQGWINLLAQLEPTDQLWSFKTKGWVADQPNSPKYLKPRNVTSGFAIVREKKVVAEFICGLD